MASTPQEQNTAQQMEDVAPGDGERVVISGMAGLYPQARYVKDLENILYNKLNPVSSDNLRWKYNHPEVAQYSGNVPDLDRFDAQFFKVHFWLGHSMDAMARKILEQTYEAIYDAGMNPKHLSGKKIGVYVGTCFSETEKASFYVATKKSGFGIPGCSKAMFANRISYWLNAKGPSMSIDEACCSSTAALEQAYKAISHGECEAAIVGGAYLCLHPQSSIHYGRIMNISMDGKTKSFAEDAAGCAKSEAINVLVLQKAKDAKRIYADVMHVKCEFVSMLPGDTGPRFGFYRNPADTVNFLKKFYDEAGVSPGLVEYVEAFGSAVPEADKSELEAIDKVFCANREKPLLVGSVMSNIGYGEAASGISAVTKVLLGFHKGELPGNLHCETPRRDVAALQEGRMRIVTANQRFQRTYTAVNCMSVTGVNAHILLHGRYKPKDLRRYEANIPRLVTVSGRQESSVQRVLDHLKSHPIDSEELALLYNIHETTIDGHLGKGFIILDTDTDQNTISLSERAEYCDDLHRPLWFVYSGMGSQWAGMGAQLMRIPIFAAAIERCRQVLEPKGIDIVHIITSPDKTIFNNILHSFVGIAAIQIGLTDILLQLGLVPDKIIGHSVGELGCAYADGCLTAEEMILSAYSRGLVSLETPFIRGSMAAVGVGFEQMAKMYPPEIVVACHNSAESCTISGPAEAMRDFVAYLTAKGIFAREVPCSNIAYHSRYIAGAGHSVGELGCAYADGCLTAEEMILSAYSRGLVSLETPFIRGSMAAVGVGFEQMAKMYPPEIVVACHNSAESCTISGPAEAMRDFVAYLTAKGIFAREVPCSNIAYHSRYIAGAGPGLLKYLKEVITTPRARSERWMSTSVPQDRWDEPLAKYSSAEYHTNNLLSPVLFEETSKLIPSNAVLVEVAPHGLLQAILKRSLPDSCTNIPLTRRGNPDNVLMFLEAVGKLYIEGYNAKVKILYPKVEFPVSTGTPFLSHYVEWAHQDKWTLPLYQSAHRTRTASCTFILSIYDDEYSYLNGHVIRNKTLVPFSFALVAAWDTLAMTLNVPKKSLDVQFRDVQFYAQPILYDHETVKLSVSLHKGSGWFEIREENSKVVTGFLTHEEISNVEEFSEASAITTTNYDLNAPDVYRLLYERGYDYRGEFRSVHSTNESVSEANILWNDNWVAFIDGIFQLNALKYTNRAVSLPNGINRMIIDVKKHLKSIKTFKSTENNIASLLQAQLCDVQCRTRCGGILLENMSFRNNLLQMHENRINILTRKFVPRFHSQFDISTSVYVLLQIVVENINKDTINVIGLTVNNYSSQLFTEVKKIGNEDSIPGIKIQYQHVIKDIDLQENDQVFKNANLILVQTLSKNKNIYQSLRRILQPNTFILNEEDDTAGAIQIFPLNVYSIVSVLKNSKTKLELACWRPTLVMTPIMTSAFTVHTESDLPFLADARNNLSSQSGLIVLTSYPPFSGLISQVKQWRRESTRNRIHVIMVSGNSEEDLNLDVFPDVNLAYNIYQNGLWGGEYFLPLDATSPAGDKVTLQSDVIGDLNSLQWVRVPEVTGTGTLVTVHYAGINVGDVNRALGMTTNSNDKSLKSCHYGLEFSGITERGERVMGLVHNGAASSHLIAQPELMWPIPSHWSLEDAATIPFAYVYAYYCLAIKSASKILTKNVKQYSVLVHGGAGALGQAVISIALAKGYRVFTTVSDILKKRLLLKLFPELNDEDIGYSRDESFGDLVLSATNGIGCNVVICCLRGKLKNTSAKCCGPSSMMLDTVQILTNENYTYGMHNLTNDRSYVAVDITSILDNPKSEVWQKVHDLISDGIALGHVRPLSRMTFAPHEAARAFRLLAASRHRGRVLLRMQDLSASTTSTLSVQPRFSSEVVGCHLILCDSSPLATQLADKVIDYGVKKIHLHFETPVTQHLQYKLRLWEKLNIQVAVTFGNLNNINNVFDLLRSAMNLGSVEGLHMIADNYLHESVIEKFDFASRTICPSLKQFIVLSDNYYGHNISVQRAKSGLPITHLDLSMLKTFQDADGFTWHIGVSEAIERALCSADPFILALPKRSPNLSLVQRISVLTGFNISEETSRHTSLEQLGMSLEKTPSVCDFLRDLHNIFLEETDILSLTVEKMKQIEGRTTETQFKEVKGLETFYSYADPDELQATTEMVFLPTLINNDTMRGDEYDMSETFLCIVPGLEGHYARFHTLCERLKLAAIVLQPGLDHPAETLKELAARYAKVLLKKTDLNKTFYILGYETGVMVALELAAILEDHGQTGTVFCIGDGPEETKMIIKEELNTFKSEESLQEGVVRHMYALMAGGSAELAEVALRGCSSWRARVDACVRTLLGRVPHSAQYARALLEAAYARIDTARRYSAAPRALRSRLVLLRARRVPVSGEECELQRYSTQPLQVHHLTAPLSHAAQDLRAPAIINRYLDEKILKAFKQKNLCDSYLLNADGFVSCVNKAEK